VSKRLLSFLRTELNNLQQAGLLRQELALKSPPGPKVVIGGKTLLNFTSADYLGLSAHPEMKKAAKAAIDAVGVGVGSPRPLSGTLELHTQLEQAVSKFLGTQDTLLFPSGYHANTGLLEALLSDQDYVFCDEQMHPSLADGVRLSRAKVFSYRNQDMEHLEDRLKRSRAARFRVIVSDGAFPVDGSVAPLSILCDLAREYEALLVVDERQGLGVLGPTGRGASEAAGVLPKVDVVSGTFGTALGGGAGGFLSGRAEVITWLRQKSRPYLISASLSPGAVGAALKALELVHTDKKLLERLTRHTQVFRAGLAEAGFQVMPGKHPAVSVLVGHAVTAQRMADALYRKGVLVTGYCHPVVPEGAARLRAQVTAQHSEKDLIEATVAFAQAAKELKMPLAATG
jgi:glycine C-acetyltransferase